KPGEKLQDKLTQLSKKYAQQLGGRQVTAKSRELLLAEFERQLRDAGQYRNDKKKERKEKNAERDGLNVDRALEARRMSDLKAKLNRALADCDLLFVPRLTRRSNGGFIPNRVHRLSDIQVECLKEFMQSGKPVLACFGPTNETAELGLPPDTSGPD